MIDAKDTYAPQKRIEPGKALIAALEAALGLIGVIVLILYLYTGSFSGAGQKLDAGISAIWLFLAPLFGQA
ncbi:hypothetical protein PQU92_07435 [Asticcacaulis sp. BYS171W]|uniref:Uncharacterized protein n=1 Tax=Asticcacaulis aquaticus TaxID=2984212 RepID=A0ABT5HST0_9CAUL|nr:hypothetical protein [Asticcacaulis aquaticus]MDC7683104.1 hypothetical protein [Asticcacaulis aquaticus]